MKNKTLEIIIVDENDEIIKYKDIDKVKQDDIYRVSALWVKNSKGEFLLAQRGLKEHHNPGQWGPAVAGTNDEGETYESNIIKEAEEGIGLKDFDYQVGGKLRRTGKYNHFCQWFVATVDKDISEFKIQKDEVEQLKWFTREELNKELENNRSKYFSSLDYCLENL